MAGRPAHRHQGADLTLGLIAWSVRVRGRQPAHNHFPLLPTLPYSVFMNSGRRYIVLPQPLSPARASSDAPALGSFLRSGRPS